MRHPPSLPSPRCRRTTRLGRLLTPLLAPLLVGGLGCYTGDLDGFESETFGDGWTTGETSGSSSGETTIADETTGAATTTTTGDLTATTDDDTDTTDDTTTTGEDTTTTGDVHDDPCPRVRVDVGGGQVLNVRPTPSTAQAPVGTLPNGAIVDVLGLVEGESLEGNSEWFEIEGLGLTGFVWSGLVECTQDEPEEFMPPDGFLLPLACGTTATVSQGNFGNFSHQGQSAYAFDFAISVGTPLVAIADGVVHRIYAETKPGDPCFNGGGQECANKANFVVLLHGDDTTSIYAHLSEVSVELGDPLPRGAQVGLSGSTGWSTGRHAHVARQESCAGSWCQSIAVSFADVPGDGVPVTNQAVTSMNCP